jgi:hypothetical protein
MKLGPSLFSEELRHPLYPEKAARAITHAPRAAKREQN